VSGTKQIIKNMGKAARFGQTAAYMMDTGKIICLMAEED
jgi:hypothetical protein